jgi:hypothetical protein
MSSRSKKMAELNRNRIDLGQSPPAAFKRAKEEVMAHPEQGGRFMTMNRNVEKFNSTIGDLVVALSDAAFEVCAEKRDAYLLVALALKRLLGRAQRDRAPIATQLLAAYPSSLVVARSVAAPLQPFINSGTCS